MWGCATASYQIEGSPMADGTGDSIWHRFSHTPGTTHNGETGDVAHDYYNRYLEDFALMKDLGLKAYRMSIAWPRIYPEGTGRINQAGLDFYENIIDALLEAEIVPFVTIYHWDLPGALQDRGGWANREFVGDGRTERSSTGSGSTRRPCIRRRRTDRDYHQHHSSAPRQRLHRGRRCRRTERCVPQSRLSRPHFQGQLSGRLTCMVWRGLAGRSRW